MSAYNKLAQKMATQKPKSRTMPFYGGLSMQKKKPIGFHKKWRGYFS
jgi:hypothetical protein